MKKKIIIGASFIAVIAIGVAIARFSPASAGNFLKKGTAIVARSWRGVFSRGDDGPLAVEIDPGVEDTATDAIATDTVPAETAPAEVPLFPEKLPVPLAKNNSPAPSGSTDTARGNLPASSSTAPVPVVIAPSASSSGSAKTSSAAATSYCAFPNAAPSSSRKVILNEIAWMGSVPATGESSSGAGRREWIELKNLSGSVLDLSGWQFVNAAGTLKAIFDGGEKISAGGFLLLARGEGAIPAAPAKAYSGALSNAGDALALFDPACGPSDFLDARSGWPGGDNATKQTLERDADGAGWHTSVLPGGTPGAENSVPQRAQSPRHLVTLSLIGQGAGSVSSNPPGILCGFDCEESYAAGTVLALSAAPDAGSLFRGWSGPCAGLGACVFTVASSVAVTGEFERVAPSPPWPPPSGSPSGGAPLGGVSSGGASPGGASSSNPTVSTSTVAASTTPAVCDQAFHIVIGEVQTAGASSSNDFVKLQNPTASAIDLGGWKLRKKSSTGADSSVKEFPSGSMVAPGGTFLWANSTDGFGDSIGANATSAATLAADNSIALFDASGTIVDAVAWGNGTDQYVEGSPYPSNPGARRALKRKFEDGAIIDTDNNADDFTI